MEDLITHANILFQSNASPPLPPAPAGEPVPSISYGSLHTKVGELPPPIRRRTPSPATQSPDVFAVPALPRSVQGTEVQAALTEDFTPQMPARPTDSIHPSLRAGPMSGSPARQSLPPPARNAQWFDENVTYAHMNPPASATIPSVPASPSRRAKAPSSLPVLPPLKSPWSESQPSLSSAGVTSIPGASALEELSALEGAHFISLDEPTSVPSPSTTFSSAISPSSSSSSVMRSPSTPPIPSKTIIPGSPKDTASYLSSSSHKRSSSLASR